MSENNSEQTTTVEAEDAAATTQPAPAASGGWSWGAFIMDVPFLIAIKKYTYLWFYLLLLIPIVNLFAILGIKIYLGMKGREMAMTSKTFASKDEYNGFMKGFDWAGKVLFFVSLAIFALGLIGGLVGAFAMGEMFNVMSPVDFSVEGLPRQ